MKPDDYPVKEESKPSRGELVCNNNGTHIDANAHYLKPELLHCDPPVKRPCDVTRSTIQSESGMSESSSSAAVECSSGVERETCREESTGTNVASVHANSSSAYFTEPAAVPRSSDSTVSIHGSTDDDGGARTDDDSDDEEEEDVHVHQLENMLTSSGIPPEVISYYLSDAGNADLIQAFLEYIQPPARDRLPQYSSLADAVSLVRASRRILVLTGAGISVSCGIPDFRSEEGIYARLKLQYPELPDPHAMFDLHFFQHDPRPFFRFAKEIFPGNYTPSPSHKFIAELEKRGKLLRNYTQNIDTLEESAGISKVVYCHGSFSHATCRRCKNTVSSQAIKEDIFAQKIPYCQICTSEKSSSAPSKSRRISGLPADDTSSVTSVTVSETLGSADTCSEPESRGSVDTPVAQSHNSKMDQLENRMINYQSRSSTPESVAEVEPILKPDIVFFGENLSSEFYNAIEQDMKDVDLLIVIGSSLKVRPVSKIPHDIPASVPQILINREPHHHLSFDIELLGDCDVILAHLAAQLHDWPAITSSGDSPAAAAVVDNFISHTQLVAQATSEQQQQKLPSEPDSLSDSGVPGSEPEPPPPTAGQSECLSSTDDLDSPPPAMKRPKLAPAFLTVPPSTKSFIPPNCTLFPGARLSTSDVDKIKSRAAVSGSDSGSSTVY